MSDDYYDDSPVTETTFSTSVASSDADEAVEQHQRSLCRDRMLGLWRSAVAGAGDAVKAAHERQRAHAPGAVPRKRRPTN